MPERDDPLWRFVHNRLPGLPSSRFFGWRCVELDVAHGTIAVEYTPKPDCLNPAGGIAEGFIAQMLDATMGPAVVAGHCHYATAIHGHTGGVYGSKRKSSGSSCPQFHQYRFCQR